MLVVIAIIGILASIIIANLSSARASSRDGKRIADIKDIQLALALYYNDNGSFPDSIYSSIIFSPKYMSTVPKDSNGNNYSYTALWKNPSGSGSLQNCTPSRPAVYYHLGAQLEATNPVLTADTQVFDSSVLSLQQNSINIAGTNYGVCDSSGAFNTNFAGDSADCQSLSAGSPEKCFDVVPN